MNRSLTSLLLVLAIAGCASGPSSAPLPPDLRIVAPDPALAPELRALSGQWTGKFVGRYGSLDHTLVVERIDGSAATVVYANGAMISSQGGGIDPGFRRLQARVQPGKIDFTLPNGAVVNYAMQADGTLAGTYDRSGQVSTARLTRAGG